MQITNKKCEIHNNANNSNNANNQTNPDVDDDGGGFNGE
jgi:hypothetical protein